MKRVDVALTKDAGLHARPADAFVRAAQSFQSSVTVRFGELSANGKAIVEILVLGVPAGANVILEIEGPDQDAAASALATLLTAPAPASAAASAPASTTGRAFIARRVVSPRRAPKQDIDAAIDHVRKELRKRAAALAQSTNIDIAGIFAAQEALLTGEGGLADAVRTQLGAGQGMDEAIVRAADEITARLAATANERTQAKSADVREIAERLLEALDRSDTSLPEPPGPWVLVTRHLGAATVADARARGIVGFVTTALSPLAHAVILARAVALPVQVVSDTAFHAFRDDEWIDVSEDSTPSVIGDLPTRRPIALRANVASVAEAAQALALGADGIGLVRTELLFASHRHAPSVDEQAAVYNELLCSSGEQLVTFRLFDAGGDKIVAFLPGDAEPRGIARLRHFPDVLASQLNALAALPRDRVRILVPFVASTNDLDLAITDLSIGAMIESAAGAHAASAIAARAAFISIGTNDLTASLTGRSRDTLTPDDVLDPNVKHAIAAIVTAAKSFHREVSICGEAATLPAAIDYFLSLGVDALSVSPLRFPDVARTLESK
ncbi:MAG: HPr family phosphocarrier protein [Deltaproteobacteria bacterium]|nr:HPr family phosphocarrier protein [Deltaproteobacteria bacterium]